MGLSPAKERFCFPKRLVIKKSREFNLVFRQGKRFGGCGFSLVFLENGYGFSRIGISVNRRIKGAVRRNRIKRIIRESFRLNRKIYPQCADLVFVVWPDFDLRSPAEITAAVAKINGFDPAEK
ncbi:MAG: ribonuclease P protein component [Deltaproteobacteria bacterium]|nr:MAG: ribonuclease P protein component [Deltaproteobacteria bacterium]